MTRERLDEIEEVERNRRGIAKDGYKAEPLIAQQVYTDLMTRYGPELTRLARCGLGAKAVILESVQGVVTPEGLCEICLAVDLNPEISPEKDPNHPSTCWVKAACAWLAVCEGEEVIHEYAPQRLRDPLAGNSLEERLDQLQAENKKLRKIAAHVPAQDYIRAKEAAGFGTKIVVGGSE